MRKPYILVNPLYILIVIIMVAISACKKYDDVLAVPGNSALAMQSNQGQTGKIGLYETNLNGNNRLLMSIAKLGNFPVSYRLIFDTGSGGMVIDAHDILPSSMIAHNGFSFKGDSVNVGGITITNKTTVVQYGTSNSALIKVYGNLAYAPVTLGDNNGNMTIKRVPFFIYYKSVDANGNQFPAHSFDILGVSTESSIVFSNCAITSPFNYLDFENGLISGFKMAKLNQPQFTRQGTFVPDAVTVGLTQNDLDSAGFMLTQIHYSGKNGYVPYVPAKVTYNGNTAYTNVLFDSGTVPYSYIQDNSAPPSLSLLPPDSRVSVTVLSSGYCYNYATTSNNNLTKVESFNASTAPVSIIGLDFFFKNEFLMDYTNHQIGFKK